MLLLNVTAGATTSGTSIPITALLNTNTSMKVQNNSVAILTPGFYEITGEVTVTSAASGSYGVTIYGNGVAKGNPSIASAAAAAETVTLPVYDIIEVTATATTTNALVTFMPVGTPTIVGGIISLKMIK